MSKVYIGVGHGGSDSGAVANGFKESNLNLAIANACANYLTRHGVDVLQSRTKDTDRTINSKVKEANAWGAELVVEIHNNAGGGDGAEVYHSVVGNASKALAQNILDAITAIGQNSRGIKTKTGNGGRDYFGIIRDTYAPAVLVECAFMDTKDIQIIDTPAEQEAMGEAIARGILKTLGIATNTSKAKDVLYRVQVGAYRDRANAEAQLEKLKAAGFEAFITA